MVSRVKCLKSDKSIVGQLLHSCKDNVNYSMKYVIKCNYIEPWQESCYKTSQWYQFLPDQLRESCRKWIIVRQRCNKNSINVTLVNITEIHTL